MISTIINKLFFIDVIKSLDHFRHLVILHQRFRVLGYPDSTEVIYIYIGYHNFSRKIQKRKREEREKENIYIYIYIFILDVAIDLIAIQSGCAKSIAKELFYVRTPH